MFYSHFPVDECKNQRIEHCNCRGFGCSKKTGYNSTNHNHQHEQTGNSIQKFFCPCKAFSLFRMVFTIAKAANPAKSKYSKTRLTSGEKLL